MYVCVSMLVYSYCCVGIKRFNWQLQEKEYKCIGGYQAEHFKAQFFCGYPI